MPNNSGVRRDKKEKKRNMQRDSEKQIPAESVESFLPRSSADSGFQGSDDEVVWETAAGEAALDNSLSSLSRPSSSAKPKETRKEERARKRKEALEKELNEESDISLSDDDLQGKESASRNISLSPTQFLQSRATRPLNRSMAKQQETMENPLARALPVQVLEKKGKEAPVDVPVEAVACVIASGANLIQRDNQGHPQGSSSVSPSSPSFNLPPTERAQLLHRSLAAELIQAGSGRSLLTPPARHSQEPGTAISMITPNVARRNNINPSVQVPEDHRAEDELRHRDELQRFGEACDATFREPREAARAAQVETASLRRAAQAVEQARVEQLRKVGEACEASVTEVREEAETAQSEGTTDRQRFEEGLEQTLAANRLRSVEARAERRRLKEAVATRPAPMAPVIDMRFCIDNLASLRIEAADHSLTDFSDYWAPDFPKTTPNKPNTFVPNHLLKPCNSLWEPFFDPGSSRQDTDGSSQVDPDHPPHFRVSQEVLGRALHTFKRKYVEDDFRRKTA
jgi:hypothetical protein